MNAYDGHNVNRTSRQHVTRTEGRFSVLEGERKGPWMVYPVYLTTDLNALASHEMFWVDPTIDYDTRAVAVLYLDVADASVSVETLTWAADAANIGDALAKLAEYLDVPEA